LHGICGVLTSKPNAKDHTICGIAGWVSYDGDLRAHQDVIRAMTETMARRGPDAGGVRVDRHVGLGHRRLAVIDRAGRLLVQESLVRECAAKARLFPI